MQLTENRIILVGCFHEIIELCEESNLTIEGIFDNQLTGEYMGYPILGNDSDAPNLYSKYKNISLIITPDDPSIRLKLFKLYANMGYHFTNVISKYAKISKTATIGIGTVIQSGVNISSFAIINDFVKINTNVNIMHDSSIGSFTTVAPNSVILGRVEVGEECYIGSNSTILPNIIIQKRTVVGAGAVVTKNYKADSVLIGVPAREMN